MSQILNLKRLLPWNLFLASYHSWSNILTLLHDSSGPIRPGSCYLLLQGKGVAYTLTLLIILHPYWSFYFSNIQNSVLPQALCTCCPLCIEHFIPSSSQAWCLCIIQVASQMSPLREPFFMVPFEIAPGSLTHITLVYCLLETYYHQ